MTASRTSGRATVVALGCEAGLEKRLLAFEIGCHLAQFGFRSLNASVGTFNVSFLHFRVQPRQNLPRLQVLADLHLTFDNPATNAKRKIALYTRDNFSCEGDLRCEFHQLDWLHTHRKQEWVLAFSS